MKTLLFLLIGGFFTFLLFLGMTYLVSPEAAEVESNGKIEHYVPFEIDDTPPPKKKRKLPEKKKPIKQPESVRATIPNQSIKKLSLINEKGLEFSTRGVNVSLNSRLGFTPWGNSSDSDNELQPAVRINPRYPVEAARKNIEGFVTLIFEISEIGKPVNIQIVESKPRGIFEKSAKRALKKWKFDPKSLKKGSNALQVTLEYQLEKEV